MRRRDRRLRGRRWRRGRGAGGRRARCDRDRVRRLLRRPGLRRLRARSADALLHGRAERIPRPERRAAGRRVPRRRDGRQLLDLVPHPRRCTRRMGLARRARLHLRRVRDEPRRGVRAARRQPGAQRALHARAQAAGRLRETRLACRRDAARRSPLRAGSRVRLLRARLPRGRQAVGRQDVAVGRELHRYATDRPYQGRARARRGRRGTRHRRSDGRGARA